MKANFSALELQGYKTFAKQTNLVFPSRITAIVGPNGSGKSNVADSIRWVLGEQSYSLLRAKKTEDMIFAGSESRARAGMASVSISFNNEENWLPIDYSEVVLTRRAYRDGQNEYLINGQRVRLRDFRELLAKTGLSDRTYTIIGQGLVDLALSIKPDERRKLFEEAAGIGLYRSRKEEAIERLEVTERNLERASDILDEIKPRLHILERQASKVADYKKVQATLQANLLNWYGYYWYKSQELISRIKFDLESSEKETEKFHSTVEHDQEILAGIREAINQQRFRLDQVNQKVRETQSDLQEARQKVAILEERKRSAMLTIADLQTDLKNSEETVHADEADLQQAEKEFDRLNRELETLKKQHSEVASKLTQIRQEKRALDSQRNEYQNKVIAAEKEAVGIRSRKNDLQERLQELSKSKETNQKSLNELRVQNEALNRQQEMLRSQLETLQKKLAEQDLLRRSFENRTAEILKSLEQSHQQTNKLNLEKNSLVNRLELLNQAHESLSGYSDGVKTLMKSKQAKSIGNSLTDLVSKLEVPQYYEVAISAALGEAIDLLVIKGKTLEKGAILKLSREAQERVAILTESQILPSKRMTLPKDEGVIGFAAELVKTNVELGPFVDALLGSFLIVKDLECALNLRPKYPDLNFVTLDGEVLQKSGVTLLGKTRQTGKVSFSRVREELEKKILDLDESLQKNIQVDSLCRAELAKLESEAQQLDEPKRLLTLQLDEIRQKLSEATLNLDKVRNQQRWIARQDEESTRSIIKVKENIEQIETRDSENLILTKELAGLISEVKERQKSIQTEDLEHQFQQLETENQVLEQALAHARVARQNSQIRLQGDQTRFEQLQTRQKNNEELLANLEKELDSAHTIVDNLVENSRILEKTEKDFEGKSIMEMEGEYQQLSTQFDLNQKELGLKERNVTQLQLELAREQEKLTTLKTRIEDDFGLIDLEYHAESSRSTPLPFPDLVIQSLPEIVELPEHLEEEIRQQKAQIRRIGAVNMEAESEYQEVRDRFTSLTEQISDLNAAISDIQKIIKDLDEIMQREFLATFKAVNAEFSRMFSRLFNGGSAHLVLSEADSPIEGGIEIEARLPGRREQGLVLLSGGERSLTAVALIFALLKVSPTPFCVLDEVDAMLDESNVGRFIDLIRDLSADTQFILITHNRNTVSAADVVYGVTMGKDSASQVISLKLDEIDDRYMK